MATFSERMIGAAKLNVGVYEEVEADTQATGQAAGVVLLSSLAGGIGSLGLGVNATYVVHSGVSGNNGGYHTNPRFLEGLPNESSS